MRILLIEDEHYAAKRLQKLVLDELPDARILDVLDSIEDSVNWLSSHIEPNLIFMDIQLADGLSFQIFEKIQVKCPIIFTTAYDEYALNAFKVNSIDYLLKPIETEALRKAINKYQEIYKTSTVQEINWKNITKEFFKPQEHFKQRFLIKTGGSYGYLLTEDIKFLMSEDGLSFAYNSKGQKFIIDKSLDKIESELNPSDFFKISRKHIIALSSISKIHPYLNNRLKLEIDLVSDEDFVVSREKVKDFKSWVDS